MTKEATNSDSPLRRFPAGVWWTAGSVVVLLLAVSGRYGFHRDELYFLVAGRRLDWGYVDQPPLTPLLANISATLGGSSPVALRVLPALALGAVVLLAAAMARIFGGGRRAQVFASVTAGGAGFALAVGHLLSTSTFDYLLWSVATYLLVRLLAGADARWWLGLGLTVGVGLQNKHLMVFFAIAVLIGLLATPQRRLLADKWPWIGVALAALISLPNLLWQVANDFPQLEMARALADRSDGPVAFALEQVGLLSIALVVPAGVGLWRLLRSPDLARWRPIGLACVLLFVFFLLAEGKSYYVAPMYPVLLAAGSLWFEELAAIGRRVMIAATALGIFIGLFIALPLLPESTMASLDATGELSETVGWPDLVDQVSEIYRTIPDDQRAATAIFTGSYGEAGAIDVLGEGLPSAVSGHNTYWLWGPPEAHEAIIGVGAVGDQLRAVCPGLRQVDTIVNPHGVENEEYGLPLWLCLAPARQLADVWDEVRHYN